MNEFNTLFGKLFIFLGILLIVVGVFFLFGSKIKFFGHLPGDIKIKKDNFTFYFPLMTCILLSILLTIILNLIIRR
ncbi:DUF2905 domain-containing protein [Candidatus Sumerlaeota bacterium]|nr:DUF2905 domain-containing protein [Candidatus Sumerlaeota bacterium]